MRIRIMRIKHGQSIKHSVKVVKIRQKGRGTVYEVLVEWYDIRAGGVWNVDWVGTFPSRSLAAEWARSFKR
jgi:hypothetical protein